MKTRFITYLLSIFFLLSLTQTTAHAHTVNSSIIHHLKSNTQLLNLKTSKHLEVIKERVHKNNLSLHLDTATEPVENESHTVDSSLNLATCIKVLVVILFLGSLLSGRRVNHYFYLKSIQISSCKYILLRSIRI